MITKVFPDEYHLHTLDQMLSAIARLNPHVDMKKIVIGLMDRLSAYAQRESEGVPTEDKQKAEEEAAVRMLEKMRLGKDTKTDSAAEAETPQINGAGAKESSEPQPGTSTEAEPAATNGEKTTGFADVRLFEIFYEQVVNLVKTRGLPIQDTMALLTSLANLAL